jgi:NADP-dependent 3-hydroxy acid dehydrogenase YdfG
VSVLRNELVVVTGASGGIGGAIAMALAKHSVRVILMGRDGAKLLACADGLRSFASSVETYACDLTKAEEIEEACARISHEHGRLDILVHCAGIIQHGNLADAPLACMDLQYAANVRGPLLLTQRLLPLLRKPRGQIVFINSSAGLNARPNAGQFSATQHAFKALADALRDEVNAEGVRISSVFPGRTATARISTLHELEGRDFTPELLLQPEDVASVVLSILTLPWTAEVTNVNIRPMLKSY